MPSFRYQPGTGLCSDTSLKPQLTTHTPRTMQTSWFLHVHLPTLMTDNLMWRHSWPRVHTRNMKGNKRG